MFLRIPRAAHCGSGTDYSRLIVRDRATGSAQRSSLRSGEELAALARPAVGNSAGEDAQRRPQRSLGDDREDVGGPPVRVDIRPVVVARDQRAAAGGRLEPVAVDMANMRAQPAQDLPGDLPVRFVDRDADGYVVAAEFGVVAQRLAIHMYDEAVA